MRHLLDNLQVFLHRCGLHRLAGWVGQWGTLPEPCVDVNWHPAGTITSSGPGWALHEVQIDGPLRTVNFDPTFRKKQGFDPYAELAWPTHLHDIN